MKKLTLVSTALALTIIASTAIAQKSAPRARTANATVTAALTTALTGPGGEYAAYSTYQAVIAKLGPVQPFARIVEAEQRHIAALVTQLQKYGITVPANPWTNIEAPDTLAEAALIGTGLEAANAAMYDQLLTAVAAYPDLVKVFTNLQSASEDNHLPAFEAAATGSATPRACATSVAKSGANCPGTCPAIRSYQGTGQRMGGRGNGSCLGACDGTGPLNTGGTCPRTTTVATE